MRRLAVWILLSAGCGDADLPPLQLETIQPSRWWVGLEPREVTIRGSNFVAEDDNDRFVARLGDAVMANVARVSDSELTAEPPPLAPGRHDLVVTAWTGASATLADAVEVVADCSSSCPPGHPCFAHQDCASGLCLQGTCPARDPCLGSTEVCPSTFARCTLDSTEYVVADFPSASPLQFMVAASAGQSVHVAMAFTSQTDTGTLTRIHWFEPACSELQSYQTADPFGEVQSGAFVRGEQVLDTGDHLIEIASDMQATASVGVWVE